MRHFLAVIDHDPDTLRHLLAEAARLKAEAARGQFADSLRHKIVGLVFEKPSLRTQVSFEAGVAQLGGTEPILCPTRSLRFSFLFHLSFPIQVVTPSAVRRWMAHHRQRPARAFRVCCAGMTRRWTVPEAHLTTSLALARSS